jgi:hypothetical protein
MACNTIAHFLVRQLNSAQEPKCMSYLQVIQYLQAQGITDTSLFSLADQGDGVFIASWEYSISQPDLATLPQPTQEFLDGLAEQEKARNIQLIPLLQESAIPSLAVGSLVYNKTLAALQFVSPSGVKTLSFWS